MLRDHCSGVGWLIRSLGPGLDRGMDSSGPRVEETYTDESKSEARMSYLEFGVPDLFMRTRENSGIFFGNFPFFLIHVKSTLVGVRGSEKNW